MSRSPSRWRTLWTLFVRGFKTLLPLPESKQEAWSYRASAAPAKRSSAVQKSRNAAKRTSTKTTKTSNAAKQKTTKTSQTTSTRQKSTRSKQQPGGGRTIKQTKKSATTRGNRGR